MVYMAIAVYIYIYIYIFFFAQQHIHELQKFGMMFVKFYLTNAKDTACIHDVYS